MRFLLPLLVIACACLTSSVNAAPRAKRKVATPHIPPVQAKPLSPAQLRGKVVYVSGRDVWAVDPSSRSKFLLYKDLFFPADKSIDQEYEYGTWPRFSRADIAWSGDLTQVVFVHRDPRFQGSELFVMNWDGSGRRQLTDDKYSTIKSNLHWSPDGKTLLFTQNSPYRMGGPGYSSEGVGMLSIESNQTAAKNVPSIFSFRLIAGNEGGGSVLDPYWSRDGKKVLLTFRKHNGEYNGDPSLQVVSLDDGKMTPFHNNWNDFLVDNQSSNGRWRVEHSTEGGFWELLRSDTIEAQGIVWQEDRGFKATRFCISGDGKDFVFDGNFTTWKIDAKGMTLPDNPTFGLWFLPGQSNDGAFPKLLVQGGQLVDWF